MYEDPVLVPHNPGNKLWFNEEFPVLRKTNFLKYT
jgi:hypothetical protein